jgi:heat shock protein HtpX
MSAARSSTLAAMRFKPVAPDDPLYIITKSYAEDLGLPPPKVGTVGIHNAFAMGTSRNDATIALGIPLMNDLNADEIAAIIGHELGHVISGDMRSMMLMRTFQNATVWFMVSQRCKHFARYVICWASELAILSSSRRREFRADAIGAALAGKNAMISALRKLDRRP